MKSQKILGWAYPTSTSAKELGFHDDGCWHVYDSISGKHITKGFADHEKDKAFAAGNALPGEWYTTNTES